MTPAVEIRSASLAYQLTRNRAGTLKEYAIQLVKRNITKERLWAVRDLSLDVNSGEVVGVIGPNGAGKSTLMKMVARVLPPTEGRVIVRGSVAPMIELGAGFNQEMTAHENIVLYGTLLGRDPNEMRQRVGTICEWAGLNDFIDVPIRSFSSGMLARLGFAVATDVTPDVLVIDEVLSVGDAAFQDRSKKRILEIIQHGAAVLFVSHDLSAVVEVCDRVLWMDHGEMKALGRPEQITVEYESVTSKDGNDQVAD